MRGQRVDPRVARHHLEESDEGLVELGKVIGSARVEVGHADDGVCPPSARQHGSEAREAREKAALETADAQEQPNLPSQIELRNEGAARTHRTLGKPSIQVVATGSGCDGAGRGSAHRRI